MTPSDFEEQLRAALRREEAPAGFSARALARASARRPNAWFRRLAWAAAACLLLGGAGLEYRRYRGEQAKQQVMLAMRITGREWQKAEVRMRQAMGVKQGEFR